MASLGRDPGIEAIGEKPDKFQKKVRGLLPLVSLTHYPPERLRIGYILAGIIPNYARGTAGTLEPTSIMYKELNDVGPHAT